MTPEQRQLLVSIIAYAAERWSVGDYCNAERLATVAWSFVGSHEFIDLDDHEVDR